MNVSQNETLSDVNRTYQLSNTVQIVGIIHLNDVSRQGSVRFDIVLVGQREISH